MRRESREESSVVVSDARLTVTHPPASAVSTEDSIVWDLP